MGRHAYMILAHTNFAQLRLLLTLLDHPDNDIYLCITVKVEDESLKGIANSCRKSRVYVLEQREVEWGKYSMVEAEMALLGRASESDHDYYHLLSGMCLPLLPQDDIHAFFDRHDGLEFVGLSPEPVESKVVMLQRITDIKRRARDVGLRDYSVIKGSQWFSITHAFARHIMDNAQIIHALFHGIGIPDELFVQTILANSPFMDNWSVIIRDRLPALNMRMIEWETLAAHPHVFTFRDEGRLMRSGNLFARKFDINIDRTIIESIARRILTADIASARRAV